MTQVLKLPERYPMGGKLLAQEAIERHVGLAQQHADADRGRLFAAFLHRARQTAFSAGIDDHMVPYDMISYEEPIRGKLPDGRASGLQGRRDRRRRRTHRAQWPHRDRRDPPWREILRLP